MSASKTFLRRATAAALLLIGVSAGFGQPSHPSNSSPVVTDDDIARVQRDTPTVTEQDIEAARRKYGAMAAPAAAPGQVNVEGLPQPKTQTPIDLESLAKGYAAQVAGADTLQGLANGPALFIFVSLSMPPATLQRLVDQAARARAPLIVRGLANGSLRDTVVQVQRLIGGRKVAFQIDPQAFDRFAVSRVPSFVLVRDHARPADCTSGRCLPADSYLLIAGDVSVDYALATMRRSAPEFGHVVDVFLKRLGG